MWQVEWEPEATNAASAYLDDRPGLADVFATLDGLRDDPYSVPAFEMGGPDHRRIHIGAYRVIILVEHDRHTLRVIHIGRVQRSR